MTVIAPAEADLAVLDSEEAVVGDGDAVGVSAEVVEDVLGTGEGPLGVDDPLGLSERLEVAGEGSGVVERGEAVAELEPSGSERPGEVRGRGGGTGGRGRGRGGRSRGGRRSSGPHGERCHRRGRRSAGGGVAEELGPRYGGWRRSRSQRRGVWDRRRGCVACGRQRGTAVLSTAPPLEFPQQKRLCRHHDLRSVDCTWKTTGIKVFNI